MAAPVDQRVTGDRLVDSVIARAGNVLRRARCDASVVLAVQTKLVRIRLMGGHMAIVHVERIICDNPDCAVYVEELIREEPGRYELVEYVRAQAVLEGWKGRGGLDFCPAH
jgi:hypothetical protein